MQDIYLYWSLASCNNNNNNYTSESFKIKAPSPRMTSDKWFSGVADVLYGKQGHETRKSTRQVENLPALGAWRVLISDPAC